MKKRFRITVLIGLTAAVLSGLLVSCGGGLPGDAVANVGEAYVGVEDFNRQVEDASLYYGITRESDPENYKRMENIILEDLIQMELAKQKAAELGVTVTDDEVEDAVNALIDEFFDGDQAAFESQLSTQDLTMEDLRNDRRDALLIQGVYDAVIADVTSVTDDEIEAYYATNQSDYLADPTINARHILISVGDSVSENDPTSTTTTTASGADSSAEPTTSESTTTTTEVSELVWAEALATAAQVRLELLRGGSWDELAEEYSDDESTNGSGGDLGEISQGLYAEEFGWEFDSALFTLQLDEVSEPIKTAGGYHIVQVTAINEPTPKTLEEVRDEIAESLLSDAKLAAWLNWIEEVTQELGVTYREDLQPTTSSTPAADPTSTTSTP